MRGITLDEIAEATKIGTRSLRALELEQFDKLPGGIFNKGFVRAYARFLGIDEEQAVADYLNATQEKQEAAGPILPNAPVLVETEASDAESPAGLPWRSMAIVVLLAAFVAAGWYGYNRWKAQQESDQAPPSPNIAAQPAPPVLQPAPVSDTTSLATPSVEPATTAPVANTPATTALAPELKSKAAAQRIAEASAIVLHIKARSTAWLKITADDKVVMSGLLAAADEKDIRADKRVVLDVGNAGGVEITQNGKPVAPLGPEGKRKIVTFTPEGLQQ